jgi:hypothetical protein
MKRLPILLIRPRPRSRTLRAAGAVGLIAALTLSLVACKGDDATDIATSATPAAAALMASAPAMSTANVPPPPAIQSAAAVPVAGAASADLASVQAQLDTTLANASACSADTDCHSVAVGAKACGGPTAYRAFSGKTVAPASVEALAQRERDLAAQAARESHEVSPCFMLADPGARCQNSKCVTGRPGTN